MIVSEILPLVRKSSAYDLQKAYSFDATVETTGHIHFSIRVYTYRT